MAKIKDLCKELAESHEYVAVEVAVRSGQPEEGNESAKCLLARINECLGETGTNIRGAVIRNEYKAKNPHIQQLLEILSPAKYDRAIKQQLRIMFEAAERQVAKHLPYLKPWYDGWFEALKQGSKTVQ